jgi:CheY-like chemotaxis protein
MRGIIHATEQKSTAHFAAGRRNGYIAAHGFEQSSGVKSNMSDKGISPPYGERTHDLDQVARWAARRKVLIVDDDFSFSDLTRMYLEENGYQVDMAGDGVQGIKKIMVSDYSVILCDMVMPNLAGDMFYTAVERVKPHLCRRIVFVTGHQGDRKVDEFIRKVRGLLLWKPFQLHVLIETMQAVEKKAAGTF